MKQDEIEKMNVQEYVLYIDSLSTMEFCDWKKLPHPRPMADTSACAEQFINLDLVKLRLIKEKAKLLSKKPSVSDEARANDLAKWHTETHSGEGDFFDELEKTYKEAYLKGLTESKSLPPQVVQSEVSCWLIENENQEWHCVREEISKTIGQFGKTVYYNEWTKNPLQAKRFSSKESAEATINVCNLKSCKATEHEFVNSLTPPDAEKEAVMFGDEFWKWSHSHECDWIYEANDMWYSYPDLKDMDKVDWITTQELFNLYKQGGQ